MALQHRRSPGCALRDNRSRAIRLHVLFLPAVVTAVICALFSACSPPNDDDPSRIISANDCPIDWGDSTAHVQTTIRFEALVDTVLFPQERFSGSGLRVAVVCLPPDTSTLPYRDIYSVSANYLDIPAAGLPFSADIPAGYFSAYGCTRIAVGVILVYRDGNDNRRFDHGETVVGAGEQSLYAFVEGRLENLPSAPFESLNLYSNVLVRFATQPAPRFRPAPEYRATIFIINVRGETGSYDLPYPWPVKTPLLP
jgi:hypothetical protein